MELSTPRVVFTGDNSEVALSLTPGFSSCAQCSDVFWRWYLLGSVEGIVWRVLECLLWRQSNNKIEIRLVLRCDPLILCTRSRHLIMEIVISIFSSRSLCKYYQWIGEILLMAMSITRTKCISRLWNSEVLLKTARISSYLVLFSLGKPRLSIWQTIQKFKFSQQKWSLGKVWPITRSISWCFAPPKVLRRIWGCWTRGNLRGNSHLDDHGGFRALECLRRKIK